MNGIIDSINARIMDATECLFGAGISVITFGLAKPIQIAEETMDTSIPAIIDNSGECHYVFTDDNYGMGCYHRLISRNYSRGKESGNYRDDIETDEILLVCWGLSHILNMQAEEVERKIIIPSIPAKYDLVASNFDAKSVLNGEFRNINYLNKPEEFIFSVKYKVSLAFQRRCREIKCN
jgi:hypothetical protein